MVANRGSTTRRWCGCLITRRGPNIGHHQGLPFDDDSFDLVAAFDVLEHIGFDDMISVLFEIRRIAPRAIVSIGYGPSGHKHPGVDELHRTIMDQKQWIKVIKDSGMIFNRIIPPKYLCFGEW